MSQSQRLPLPKPRMLSRGGRINSGIRITNVKSIKPPDSDSKLEEDRLRSQLQKEIVSRSRACAYKKYSCLQPVVRNRQHCWLHITQEPQSGYKQCSHSSGNTRCIMPAPSDRENSLCFEHARLALLARHRSSAPPPPLTTTETLLNQLQHYVRGSERVRTTSCASSVSVVSDPAESDPGVAQPLDPFKEIDALSINASYSTYVTECASADASSGDDVTEDERRGPARDLPLRSGEGALLDQPLWRAGVFTAEEAIRSARDTLVQLQSGYKKQMRRLQVLLRTARLKYLRGVKAERESCCSINTQARSAPLTPHERKQLKKLKAFASYRRRHGVHAILAKKQHIKRAQAAGVTKPAAPAGGARCIYTEFTTRCSNQALPAARVCATHVLHDTKQVLFSMCGDPRGGVPCATPVPRLPLPAAACRYHTAPPHYTLFSLKKDGDSDSESHSTSTATELTELLEQEALEARGAPTFSDGL